MYTVKMATEADLDQALEIAQQFWNESEHYKKRNFNPVKVRQHLTNLIHDQYGYFAICFDKDNNIIGGYCGSITPEWQSDSLMAFDWCIFVNPQYRGGRAISFNECFSVLG